MVKGQSVEVLRVMSSRVGGPTPDDYRWARGYVYVKPEKKAHRVKITKGMFEGLEVVVNRVRPI